jgi:aarF domain-containing kinase
MRPDLFDSRICRELSKLQSGARVHSWEQTRGILQSILGEHWEETLQLKSDDLVGSGCVAQVYRGKVLVRSQGSGTGKDASTSGMEREVAVKVLHPRVRESMHLDLNLMRSIAHAAEWAGETLLRLLYGNQDGTVALAAVESYPLRCVSLLESVDEFSDFMLSQLDLRHEAAALERLR